MSVDLDVVSTTLAELGQPNYRTKQIWRWASQGAPNFDAMTDLPAALRTQLTDRVPFSTLTLLDEAHAKDGTIKAVFQTADGRPLEAVLMVYRDGRRSLCLSSQSGCPLTCTFCATGQMRFGRNLTASEILDQALHFRRLGPTDHAVFMGMGEPMMNLDAVLEACALLPDVGITNRRTAVSTRRLDSGDQPARRRAAAAPARAVPARRRRRAALAADAGQRPLSARRRDRRAARRSTSASGGWCSSST